MTISMKLKMEKMRNGLIMAIVLSLFIPWPAYALHLGFDNITNNNPDDVLIGKTQLFVDVTDVGNNQVLFRFGNTGMDASSICQVYFDDGSLLGIALIDNSSPGTPGVLFGQGGGSGKLPGAKDASPPFVTTQDFFATSASPTQPYGVNPGEYLGIKFDLQSNPKQKTFNDVLAELASGELRIGIHVQGFESGESESFVNSIPDPYAVFLLGSACLIGFAGARRKFKK